MSAVRGLGGEGGLPGLGSMGLMGVMRSGLCGGLGEDEFDEFLRVDLGGQFGAAAGEGLLEQVADGEDAAGRPGGGGLDGGEHEENPSFPRAVLGDAAEEAVIVGFVLDEVATEVEDADAEQAGVDEEEDTRVGACVAYNDHQREQDEESSI